jgi:hypothetical protein
VFFGHGFHPALDLPGKRFIMVPLALTLQLCTTIYIKCYRDDCEKEVAIKVVSLLPILHKNSNQGFRFSAISVCCLLPLAVSDPRTV